MDPLKLLFDNEKLPGRRLYNRLISSMKESYLCRKDIRGSRSVSSYLL